MPASEQEFAYRVEPGIIKHHRLVYKPQRFRSALEASPVSPANVGIGDIVPSLRDAKTYALDVQLGIAQRNVDSRCFVPRKSGLTHYACCPMTGQSCFHREAPSIRQKLFAAQDRFAGGTNCGSGRLSSIDPSRYSIGIN